MAAAAAGAALGALSSFHASSSILSKSRCFAPCRNLRTRLPFLAIRASSSSSSSPSPSPTSPPAEFNITFGVAPKSSVAAKSNDSSSAPLFIPWIVRDENGNLKLQSTPPDYLLHAMAHSKTISTKKKKKEKEKEKEKEKALAASASAEPKHSKAARRFYNENFREPQRLSKVLAAAGGGVIPLGFCL